MSGFIGTGARIASGIGASAATLANVLANGLGGATALSIAGIPLTAFEVPEAVREGLRQQIAVLKFLGGARQLQCIGADPDDISWAGTVLGQGSDARARQLRALAGTGQVVPLLWGNGYVARVVVAACSIETRFGVVRYQITCVVQPPTPPAAKPGAIAGAQGGIAGALSGLSSGIAAIAGTVATAQQAVGAVTAVVTPITGPLGIHVPFLASASAALSEAAAGANGLTLAGQGAVKLNDAISGLSSASAVIGSARATIDAALGGLGLSSPTGMSAAGAMAAANLTGQQATLAAVGPQTDVAIQALGAQPPPAATGMGLGADGAVGAVPPGVVARAGSPLAGALGSQAAVLTP